MKQLTCGFIGLGLIGGSIAKAIKQYNSSVTLYAYDPNPANLYPAKEECIIDHILSSLDEISATDEINSTISNSESYYLSACDIIFLCAPVSKNNENLNIIKKYISKNTILTDVGSVKNSIHEHISTLELTDQFIGGHPMTGSEKSGYSNSQAIILENAYYILTPAAQVSSEKIALMQELVTSIKAVPIVLDAVSHDYITAAISHVPHLIASALVNLVKDSDSADGMMKTLAAGGFKDITRIASSSPEMWEAICLSNADNITSLLSDYIASLEDIKRNISDHKTGYVHQLFDCSKNYRDSFNDSASGPIKKTYLFFVDIPDVTGSIATLATILASHMISIKNIGIIHNREFEEGVLRIEFYDDLSKKQAMDLLTKMQYTIFDRK